MVGSSKKKSAPAMRQEAASLSAHANPNPIEVTNSFQEAFRVLEIATLSLDGMSFGLTEARMLARIASRPEGSAQRGLIAARYAYLKEQVERCASEAALEQSDTVAIAFGADQEGRQGSLMARSLPPCKFETQADALALMTTLDKMLHLIANESDRLREAAGQIADHLAAQAKAAQAPARDVPPLVETGAAPNAGTAAARVAASPRKRHAA